MTQNNFALCYNFSRSELTALAKILRDGQNKIPIELYNFSREVQKKVYDCMSINDLEKMQDEAR